MWCIIPRMLPDNTLQFTPLDFIDENYLDIRAMAFLKAEVLVHGMWKALQHLDKKLWLDHDVSGFPNPPIISWSENLQTRYQHWYDRMVYTRNFVYPIGGIKQCQRTIEIVRLQMNKLRKNEAERLHQPPNILRAFHPRVQFPVPEGQHTNNGGSDGTVRESQVNLTTNAFPPTSIPEELSRATHSNVQSFPSTSTQAVPLLQHLLSGGTVTQTTRRMTQEVIQPPTNPSLESSAQKQLPAEETSSTNQQSSNGDLPSPLKRRYQPSEITTSSPSVVKLEINPNIIREQILNEDPDCRITMIRQTVPMEYLNEIISSCLPGIPMLPDGDESDNEAT